MRSINSTHFQQGLELYSHIESLISDYLVGGGERDEDMIFDYIKKNTVIRRMNSVESGIRSIIIAYLKKESNSKQIQQLQDEVTSATNKALSIEEEMNIVYSYKGVLTVSFDGIIESINDSMIELSGYSREELIGQNINIMSSGMHTVEFWQNFYKTIKSGKVWVGEITNKKKDGTIIEFWTLVIPKKDESGKDYFKVIRRDISEIKNTAENLAAIRNNKFDPFTNLPTKKQMYIDRAESLPKRLSVVHINNMRDMNMAFGESIGGILLQKVAHLLRKYALSYPELGIKIYKLAGPDFAVTYDTQKEQEFFDEIYKKMNTIHFHNFGVTLDSGKDLTIQPSFSFGVALEGSDINSFLSNALSALTVSKGQSNGFAVYEESINMQEISKEKIDMKSNVRNAFNNNGFVLEYQPIIEVLSYRHIGKLFKNLFYKKGKDELKYEVLVRMIDPQDPSKLISPGAFLPIIEEEKQNIQLTTRVIKLACEFMLVNPGNFSINMTAADLNMVGRAKMITEQILEFGLNMSRFTIEVLENIEFLTPVALDNIDYFVKKGARISIDDYGTAYSTINRLRRLRAHFLKLDMSFVRGIDTNPDNRADVRIAIKAAHKMDAEVIAEGVQTQAEKRALIELGVDYIQGYLTGRPKSSI